MRKIVDNPIDPTERVTRGDGRATNIRKYIGQPDMPSSPPAVNPSLFHADGTLG
jgi:hypothetical protein